MTPAVAAAHGALELRYVAFTLAFLAVVALVAGVVAAVDWNRERRRRLVAAGLDLSWAGKTEGVNFYDVAA